MDLEPQIKLEIPKTPNLVSIEGPDGLVFSITDIPGPTVENPYSNTTEGRNDVTISSTEVIAEGGNGSGMEEKRNRTFTLVATGIGALGTAYALHRFGAVPEGVSASIGMLGFGKRNTSSQPLTGRAAKHAAPARIQQMAEDTHLRLHPENRVDIIGDPLPPYDSIRRWDAAFHRQQRNPGSIRNAEREKANANSRANIGPGSVYDPSNPFDIKLSHGTESERRIAIGLARTANKINFYDREAVKFLNLYGDILRLSKTDLKLHLSATPMTRKERKAILNARELVHHAEHAAHERDHVIDEMRNGQRTKLPRRR